jgi:hypothetical protein
VPREGEPVPDGVVSCSEKGLALPTGFAYEEW